MKNSQNSRLYKGKTVRNEFWRQEVDLSHCCERAGVSIEKYNKNKAFFEKHLYANMDYQNAHEFIQLFENEDARRKFALEIIFDYDDALERARSPMSKKILLSLVGLYYECINKYTSPESILEGNKPLIPESMQ